MNIAWPAVGWGWGSGGGLTRCLGQAGDVGLNDTSISISRLRLQQNGSGLLYGLKQVHGRTLSMSLRDRTLPTLEFGDT